MMLLPDEPSGWSSASHPPHRQIAIPDASSLASGACQQSLWVVGCRHIGRRLFVMTVAASRVEGVDGLFVMSLPVSGELPVEFEDG